MYARTAFLLFLATIAALSVVRKSPTESFDALIQSIDENDLESIHSYLDLNGFSSSIFNKSDTSSLPIDYSAKDLKSEIEDHLLSRRGRKSHGDDSNQPYSLLNKARGWSFDLLQYTVFERDGLTYVSIPAYPDTLMMRVDIELLLQDKGLYWQVSHWSNQDAIKLKIASEKEAALRAHNARAALRLEEMSKSDINGVVIRRPGLHSGLIKVSDRRVFATEKRVTGLSGVISVVDVSSGKLLQEKPYTIAENSVEFAKTTVLNHEIVVGYEQGLLADALADGREIEFRSSLTRVVLADGMVTALYSDYDALIGSTMQ